MKVWLDDVRRPPDESWVWVQTSEEAIGFLRYAPLSISEISLDHDLGLWDTGRPVAEFIAMMAVPPGIVRVHSMNPVGAKALIDILGDRLS